MRERDGEGQSREAGAGSEVGDHPRSRDRLERQRAQRIGHVHVDGAGTAHGARCEWVGAEELERAGQGGRLKFAELPARRQFGEAPRDGAHPRIRAMYPA